MMKKYKKILEKQQTQNLQQYWPIKGAQTGSSYLTNGVASFKLGDEQRKTNMDFKTIKSLAIVMKIAWLGCDNHVL